MATDQAIQALKDAQLYDAFIQQINSGSVDNLSMLLAVATGLVFRQRQIFEIVESI